VITFKTFIQEQGNPYHDKDGKFFNPEQRKQKPNVGRPPTLPNTKRTRTSILLTPDTLTRLKLAVVHEQSKRRTKVDQSLLVEEALKQFLKKKKY
jgi:hypothetical protein